MKQEKMRLKLLEIQKMELLSIQKRRLLVYFPTTMTMNIRLIIYFIIKKQRQQQEC